MIKIPTDGIEKNKELFFDDVLKSFKSLINSKQASGDAEYSKLISKYLIDSTGVVTDELIKRFLSLDYNAMLKIIDDIGDKKDKMDDVLKLYTNFVGRSFSKKWPLYIGMNTCPYCNRNYIYTIPKKSIRPEYDHFFSKAHYPYLCLCLYNLIPSCRICNSKKSDADVLGSNSIIYPYLEEFGNDGVFKIVPNGYNITDIISPNKKLKALIDVNLLSPFKTKINNSKEMFALESLYEMHSDYIHDLIKLSQIYNDDFINYLISKFPWLSNVSSAKNTLFLTTLDKKDWHKRTLSKLTFDVINQFQR